MVKMKYLLTGVLIVIIGVVLAVTLFPSEEKRVKKRFRLLSEWVSKSPEENAFTLLQKMKDIGTLFSEPCELKAPDESLSGGYTRQEISAFAGGARSHFSRLDLTFHDLHIVFPEREIAKVTLTARLIGRSTTGEPMDEIRELECLLKKIDSKWLFNQIEVVQVLKK
jgi:hypothetical protein